MGKKKLKIGFIMGGGVSMGSFSSGALEYVIKNLSQNLNTNKYSKCEIDVFSGSSAGSVTLTACAFELCRGNFPDLLLQRLWLDKDKGLDIQTLIPDSFEKQQEPSILSTKIMKAIKEDIFVKSDLSQAHPKTDITGKEIRIGLSITNLNGIRQDNSNQIINPDYLNNNYSSVHDVTKTYWHGDRRLFKIQLNDQGIQDLSNQKEYRTFGHKINKGWIEMGDSAQASGAFPFAFAPFELLRFKEEFDRFWPYGADKSHTYFYADGGIINNEPLKLAMNMAYDADIGETEDFERIFVVIDPIVGNETYDLEIENTVFPAIIQNKDYFKELFIFGERFFGMLFSEVRYKDWQKADKLNNRIKWTEDFIRKIPYFLKSINDSDTVETLKASLLKDFEAIFIQKFQATSNAGNSIPDKEYIDSKIQAHLEIVSRKYADEMINLTPEQKELFALVGALLENISGVRKKQLVKLIGIAPTEPSVTKGDFLSAFGGFFDENWRKYDYEAGKFQAYKILDGLPEQLKLTSSGLEKIHKRENGYSPSYKDAPVMARKKFENYLYGMIISILGYLKFGERLKIGLGFIFFRRKVAREIIKILTDKLNQLK